MSSGPSRSCTRARRSSATSRCSTRSPRRSRGSRPPWRWSSPSEARAWRAGRLHPSGRIPAAHGRRRSRARLARRALRARNAVSSLPRPASAKAERTVPRPPRGGDSGARVGREDPHPPAGPDVVGDEEDVLPPQVHVDDLAAPGPRGLRALPPGRADCECGRAVVRPPLHPPRRRVLILGPGEDAVREPPVHDGEHGPLPGPARLPRRRAGAVRDPVARGRAVSGRRGGLLRAGARGGGRGGGGGTMDAWEAMRGLAEVPSDRRSPDVRRALGAGAEFFLRQRLLHEGPRYERWYWLRYPWHYHYDVLVGLDFMTALGYAGDPRMREALDHLESKRLPDGRWKLDHTNGDLVIEPRGRPSKMITFLALRALRRAGRTTPRASPSGAGTRRGNTLTAPSGS